jgi:hypothetical protein
MVTLVISHPILETIAMSTKTKAKPAKKATKAAAAKPSTKKAAAAPQPAKRKPAPVVDPAAERSAAISAAMLELADVRTAAREKRNGVPAKHVVFDAWFKSLSSGKAFDVDAMAAKMPEVKDTTIKSWCNSWRLLNNLPSNGRGKEKLITAALKKQK